MLLNFGLPSAGQMYDVKTRVEKIKRSKPELMEAFHNRLPYLDIMMHITWYI